MRCLDGVDINDQRVGLRLDLNVPIKNGTILDNTRIIAIILVLSKIVPFLIGTLRSNLNPTL